MSAFKIGDMVRIVSGKTYLGGVECGSRIGQAGTVVGTTQITFLPDGIAWKVALAHGGTMWAATVCLRLIPGDQQGRTLVEWDWRELTSKQPECV